MQKNDSYFKNPLTLDYWRFALSECKDFRRLVVAALLIALEVALGWATIYLTVSLRVSVTFLATAVRAMICGPILAPISSVVCDVVTFLLTNPTGEPFFPGYTISAALGSLVFALFLYRRRVTFANIIISRGMIDVFINTLLNSVWRVMLYGTSTYWLYVGTTGIKNLVLLPLEAAALALVIGALAVPMKRMKLVGDTSGISFKKKYFTISIIISLITAGILITMYLFDLINIG